MVLRFHAIVVIYVEDRKLSDQIEAEVAQLERRSPPSAEQGSTQLTTMERLMATVLEHFGGLGPTDDFQIRSTTTTPRSQAFTSNS
jgi:hypothetical protein